MKKRKKREEEKRKKERRSSTSRNRRIRRNNCNRNDFKRYRNIGSTVGFGIDDFTTSENTYWW